MIGDTLQQPHSHEVVREAILVLEGAIIVEEIVEREPLLQELSAGDLVVFDRAVPHRIKKNSEEIVRTLNFKFLGDGKDAVLFAGDKNVGVVRGGIN